MAKKSAIKKNETRIKKVFLMGKKRNHYEDTKNTNHLFYHNM